MRREEKIRWHGICAGAECGGTGSDGTCRCE